MSDKELVERLLDFDKVTVGDARDAALRIEALTEQLEAARADAKEAEAYAEELEDMNKNQEAMIRQADRRGDALEAKLAKAVELLKEARQDLEEYVTHEWPKDEHPVYERKWERDMELCRRIDATLAEIEGEKG
jgi:predicted  nucleic acid-binding Zn-ribbon protein